MVRWAPQMLCLESKATRMINTQKLFFSYLAFQIGWSETAKLMSQSREKSFAQYKRRSIDCVN